MKRLLLFLAFAGIASAQCSNGTTPVFNYLKGHMAVSCRPIGSTQTIYLSQVSGIHQDGSLSANTGTDDYAAIQAVLDTASAASPLVLLQDKVSLIDTAGGHSLTLKSHTTVQCLNHGTGFSWKAGTSTLQSPIFVNANPVGATAPTDTDIEINGCAFQGNAETGHGGQAQLEPKRVNSANVYLAGMRFVGVTDLRVKNVRFFNVLVFSVHIGNIQNGLFENLRCEETGLSAGGNCLQSEGYTSNTVIRNVSGNSRDDLVALNADDSALYSSCAMAVYGSFGNNALPSTMKAGAITNVLIDGLWVESSFEAIRLFSATSLIDNVTVRNVYGGTVGHWFSPDVFPPCGATSWVYTYGGNFGNIRFENINLTSTLMTSEYGYGEITALAKFKSLYLDLNIGDWSQSLGPVLLLTPLSNIQTLELKVRSSNTSGLQAPIVSQTGGWVGRAILDIAHDAAGGSVQSTQPVWQMSGGRIGTLDAKVDAEFINNIVYQSGGGGYIDTMRATGRHSNATGTLNQQSATSIVKNAVVSGLGTPVWKQGSGTVTNTYAGVAADAVASAPSLLNGLIGAWKLTEGSGSRADSSGDLRTMAQTGTVTGGAASGGQSGNTATFSSGNYLTTAGANFTVRAHSGATFAAWVYMSSVAAANRIISKSNGSTTEFVLYTDPTFGFCFHANAAAQNQAACTGTPSTNTWYFVVGGWDPSNNKAFISVDAASSGAKTYASVAQATLNADTGQVVGIGYYQINTTYFAGEIGHVYAWQRVLTAAEIVAMYNSGAFYDPI